MSAESMPIRSEYICQVVASPPGILFLGQNYCPLPPLKSARLGSYPDRMSHRRVQAYSSDSVIACGMIAFSIRRIAILLVTSLSTIGCGHALSPLFKDYRIDDESTRGQDIGDLLERAVEDAGWEIDKPDAPNVVSTKEETVAHWGLYKLVVSLDVVPINGTHVRVFVHPYRVYVWGSRSKMFYMGRRVRNFVVPGLTDALTDVGVITLDVEVPEIASD